MANPFQEQSWMQTDEDAFFASIEGRLYSKYTTPLSGDTLDANTSLQQGDDDGEQPEQGEHDEEEEEEAIQAFYCVACEKAFKSEKQFMNHEASKKHLKNLKAFKKSMKEEDIELFGSTKGPKTEEPEDFIEQSDGDLEDELEGLQIESEEELENVQIESDTDKNMLNDNDLSSEEHETLGRSINNNNNDNNRGGSGNNSSSNDDEDNDNEEEIDRELLVPRSSVTVPIQKATAQKEKKASKSRRRKKPNGTQEEGKDPSELKCNVCRQSFSSRNKLFGHIQETGHALRKWRWIIYILNKVLNKVSNKPWQWTSGKDDQWWQQRIQECQTIIERDDISWGWNQIDA